MRPVQGTNTRSTGARIREVAVQMSCGESVERLKASCVPLRENGEGLPLPEDDALDISLDPVRLWVRMTDLLMSSSDKKSPIARVRAWLHRHWRL